MTCASGSSMSKHFSGVEAASAWLDVKPVVAPRRNISPVWRPRVHGWMKLNTDGSYVSNDSAGAGIILHNNMGAILFLACTDALEAKLCACIEGLSVAIQRTKLPIVIEMDSEVTVSMISCDAVDRSVYASSVNEIRFLLRLG